MPKARHVAVIRRYINWISVSFSRKLGVMCETDKQRESQLKVHRVLGNRKKFRRVKRRAGW